ncbi:MAG: hypothetical protein KDA42_18410, partial [Planctomycetales bacterium]|nr:hypothetical protein [Planctomycetales bacterium]
AALAAAQDAQFGYESQRSDRVTAKPSATELRQSVATFLRQEATTEGEENEQAVRGLIRIYRQLQDDSALVKSSRDRLTNLVRNRLRKVAARLEKERPDGLATPTDLQQFLAQQLNQFGQGLARAPAEIHPGEALVDLIKATVQPNTWVDRGGNGEVMLFPPLRQVGVFGNQANIQQGGGFGPARQGGAFGAPADDGEDLVELIQTVIAPDSWDVNGGPGSIFYWPNLRVLVIRQTDEVHDNIGGALGQLRQAGN